jgi:uncharacterized protein (DUF1330 family)
VLVERQGQWRGNMAAYVLLNIEVTDPVRFAEYAKAASVTVEQYGGKYLVRGGRSEALEGSMDPKRVVVLEFPTYERARAWWDSSEYDQPKRIRQAAARADALIVDGV